MTRVLVIEDELATRQVLTDVLTRLGYETLVAPSGRRGVELASQAEPELILLDLGLPDVSGLDVIRELRAWTQTPVLVVSGSTQHRRKAEALDAGADDFLDKPFDMEELRARLRAAERRLASTHADMSMARAFGPLMIDPSYRSVERDGGEVRLTETEWQLLDALSRQPGRVITHRWLAKHLWGPRVGPESTASLRSHLRALRAKIGDDAREPVYIRTESGVGYRWIHPPTGAPRDLADVHALAKRFRVDLETALGRVEGGYPLGSYPRVDVLARLRRLGDEVVDLAAFVGDGLRQKVSPPNSGTSA